MYMPAKPAPTITASYWREWPSWLVEAGWVTVWPPVFSCRPSGHMLWPVGELGLGDRDQLVTRDRQAMGSLVEPGRRRGVAPEGLAARVVQAPADRLPVGISDQVVVGVELDAVAVRVTQIEEEGVGDAVAARAALDAR